MKIEGFTTTFVHSLDYLTDRFPVVVPKIFQWGYLGIVANPVVNSYIRWQYAQKLRRVGAIKKALIIVDVNIGDAVIMQSSVRALKACYPEAEIDYACNAAGGELVAAIPEIHRVHNLFTQFMLASERDLDQLRETIQREQYDVIFSLSPFLRKKELHLNGIPFIKLLTPLGSEITRDWTNNTEKIHLTYMGDAAIRLIAAKAFGKAVENADVRGSTIYLTHDAVAEAAEFLNDVNLAGRRIMLLLHSDAPFRYTQIPLQMQAGVIEQVLRTNADVAVLISCGNARDGADRAVIAQLPEDLQRKVILVPRMTIPGYAALIDACDVYIAGDTGTMHIAAARKVPLDERDTMRNRTAVIGVYGATSTRMSGYDSTEPGHIPGMQSAPAKAFNAPAPCRNISCIAKPSKACATVRCFDGLTAREIADFALDHLSKIPKQLPRRETATARDTADVA